MLFAKTQELKLKFVFVLAFFLNLILITGKSLIWQCQMPVKRTLKFQVACSLHKDPKMGFHSLSPSPKSNLLFDVHENFSSSRLYFFFFCIGNYHSA